MPDARKHIQDLPPVRLRVTDAIGRQQWQVIVRGQLAECFYRGFFAAKPVALDFHEEMLRAENTEEFFDESGGGLWRTVDVLVATGQSLILGQTEG